jgi:aerobic-type carbon monoxide dehydrogenase small subunit (CoxS/CutS family)
LGSEGGDPPGKAQSNTLKRGRQPAKLLSRGADPEERKTIDIRLTINGQLTELDIDPRQSLLDALREELDLTGSKKGCSQGACGACTVLLDRNRGNASLMLAVMHDGETVTTIEGLAKGGTLHKLQAAFIAHDGFQCGYYTTAWPMSDPSGSVPACRPWHGSRGGCAAPMTPGLG